MVPGMTIKVRAAGEDHEAGPIWAADIIALERKYDVSGFDAIFGEDTVRTEYLAFIAHHALLRAKVRVPEFDEFLGSLETITPEFEGGEEGKAPAPNRAQRRGSSRRSSASSASPGETSRPLAATS